MLALEVHGSGVVYNGCNRADAGAHVRDRVAGLVVPGMRYVVSKHNEHGEDRSWGKRSSRQNEKTNRQHY